MRSLRGIVALQGAMLALLWSVAGTVPAAGAPPQNPRAPATNQELGEVLVEGTRTREKNPQRPINWMARLVGRFVVDGSVDLRALGRPEDQLQVQGRADCLGYGMGPAVQCELKLRWPEKKGPNGEEIPGGTPNMNPAVVLFGFEPVNYGIVYTLMDSKGYAETAESILANADTLETRSPCGAVLRDCEHVIRITAAPDLKQVEMRIDLELEQKKAVRYTFVMHRVPGSPSIVYGRKK